MLRERILTMGGPGSGKSFSWLKLADFFKDSKFYVIDSEKGAYRSLQEFPNLTNVEVHEVVDWPEYEEAKEEISKSCRESDWVVLDMADKAWSAVQRYFVTAIHQKGINEYLLDVRKSIEEARGAKKNTKSIYAGAFRGWMDWPVINKLYEEFIFTFIYRIPASLYIATAGQAVSEEDSPDLRRLCGPYGIRPAGQKNLAFQPDTVLLLTHESDGYFMTTLKDRGGRRYFGHMFLHDFAKQYGVEAKWW